MSSTFIYLQPFSWACSSVFSDVKNCSMFIHSKLFIWWKMMCIVVSVCSSAQRFSFPWPSLVYRVTYQLLLTWTYIKASSKEKSLSDRGKLFWSGHTELCVFCPPPSFWVLVIIILLMIEALTRAFIFSIHSFWNCYKNTWKCWYSYLLLLNLHTWHLFTFMLSSGKSTN